MSTHDIYFTTSDNIIKGSVTVDEVEHVKSLESKLNYIRNNYNFSDIISDSSDSQILKYASDDKDRWYKVSKVYFKVKFPHLKRLLNNPIINNPNFVLSDLPDKKVDKIPEFVLDKANDEIIYGLISSRYTKVNLVGMKKFLKLLNLHYPKDYYTDMISNLKDNPNRSKDIADVLKMEGITEGNPFKNVLIIVTSILKGNASLYDSLKSLYDNSDKNVTYDTSYKDNITFSDYTITVPVYDEDINEELITLTFSHKIFVDDIKSEGKFKPKIIKRYILSNVIRELLLDGNTDIITNYANESSSKWRSVTECLIANSLKAKQVNREVSSKLVKLLNDKNIVIDSSYHDTLRLYQVYISPELVLKMTDDIVYVAFRLSKANVEVMTYCLFRFLSNIFPNNKTYRKRMVLPKTSKLLTYSNIWDIEIEKVFEELQNCHVSNLVSLLTAEKYILGRDLGRFSNVSEYLRHIGEKRILKTSNVSMKGILKLLAKIE